jgi:type VI protein secretion system component VasF
MRSQHVPRADRPRVEAAAGRYREFRRGRAEVVKLGTELVHQLDAFQRTLTEPYPPAGRQTKPRRPSGRSGE